MCTTRSSRGAQEKGKGGSKHAETEFTTKKKNGKFLSLLPSLLGC
jgi:hypothetical protein